MDLAAAMGAIYGADLADFMAARKDAVAEARAAGDRDLAKRIGALRKPTLSAWVTNRVVRDRPEFVARLTDLGARMRAAQASMDAATLSGLRPERDEVFADILSAAGDLGVAVSSAALEEVRAGLVASLADASAEQAVTSGHLTRAVSYAGFGEVDLDDALAVPAAELLTSAGADDDAAPAGEASQGRASGRSSRAGTAAGRTTSSADKAPDTPADTADVVDPAAASPAKASERPAGGDATGNRAAGKGGQTVADREANAKADRHRRALDRAQHDAREAERDSAAAQLALADAEEAAAAAHRRAQELARLATSAAREASSADDVTRKARAKVAAAKKTAKEAESALRTARAAAVERPEKS